MLQTDRQTTVTIHGHWPVATPSVAAARQREPGGHVSRKTIL